MEKSNKNDKMSFMTILMLIASGAISLTDDQIGAIRNIVFGANGNILPIPTSPSMSESSELICGLSGLASFLKVSLPTASMIHSSGRFRSAQVHFGGRKLFWNKAKLLEIAEKENK